MNATQKAILRIIVWVLGVWNMITAPRMRTKEIAMAKIIEFYIPKRFRGPMKWVPELQRGKLLEFCPPTKKSA